ncbi:hypothetical protein ACQ4PT_057776 [Festuca glaucescens]
MATSSTAQPPLVSSLPCLIFDNGDEQLIMLYSVSDGTHRPGAGDDIGELLCNNKLSWVTSHGWVLVWDPATRATYLWNPHGRQRQKNRIALPSLARPPAKAGCVLSAEPTDGAGCTVLLADMSTNLMWYCRLSVGDSDGWVGHEYDVGSVHVPADYVGPTKRVMYHPASCGGRFYYQRLADESSGVQRRAHEGVQLVPVGGYVAAASPYLLDLDGELYVTYIFFRDIDFHAVKDVGVYRLDFKRKEAVRMDGIGDRAILVGSSRAFMAWCPATTFGLLPNSVYWMSPYDSCLCVYDIEHKTKQVREPCGGAAVQSAETSFWMIPTHL